MSLIFISEAPIQYVNKSFQFISFQFISFQSKIISIISTIILKDNLSCDFRSYLVADLWGAIALQVEVVFIFQYGCMHLHFTHIR